MFFYEPLVGLGVSLTDKSVGGGTLVGVGMSVGTDTLFETIVGGNVVAAGVVSWLVVLSGGENISHNINTPKHPAPNNRTTEIAASIRLSFGLVFCFESVFL